MINFQDVTYRYQSDTKESLRNITLHIAKGEFVLVTGRSGCGKTTLSKCINGLIPYFHEGELSGKIEVCGMNTERLELHEIGEKVGSVFQDPRSQFFTTDTTDEVVFGCQNMGLPRKEIFKRLDEAFASGCIDDLRNRCIFHISSGEKQKVAVASCRAMRPSIYVFDEPSSNLDIRAVEQLVKSMYDLKQQGHTIVVMEHRLYYLRDLVDRILYMADGEISAIYTPHQFRALSQDKTEAMGLRSFDLSMARHNAAHIQKNSSVTLCASHLAFSYPVKKHRKRHVNHLDGETDRTKPVIWDVSFTACGGEIVGIIGNNGAGKTTLAKLLSGLLIESGGTVAVNGEKLKSRQRIKNAYFVMQDSDYQLFEDSVLKELTLGNNKTDEENCKAVLRRLGIEAYIEHHPAALSRGQKQRLTIACSIVSDAPLIFFDEPTSGLDNDSMKSVAEMIQQLAAEGRMIFVISHDYEFLLAACTRILYLQDGVISDDFPLNDDSSRRVLMERLFPETPREAVLWR